MKKWRSDRGSVTRMAVILLALIAVMLIIIAKPAWDHFRFRSERIGCVQALKSAGDGLIIEYLSHFKDESVQEAMAVIDDVMPARPDLCPAKGTIYLVRDEYGIYEPVCGLHDTDKKRRTRLNASRAKELVENALWERKPEEEYPAAIELNGGTLECTRVQEEARLKRGTSTTKDYKGIVVLYGLSGEGEFESSTVPEGEICYFVYADEDYCAVWHADDEWTGNAYD